LFAVTPRRAAVLSCAIAVALVAAPAAARATTESASSGAVSATFSYHGRVPEITGETLAIARSGRVVYRARVSAPPYCPVSHPCWPLASGRRASLHVLDLEPGGQPDVILDLFSGGAHCCTIEQVFSFDSGTGTYVPTTRDFGDPPAPIEDLGHNGRYEFVTADDSFAYRFTDFAGSGLPLEILTFAHRRFTNVTRRYPKLIARDAASFLRAFKHDLADGDGLIAAWAADEDNLGHEALVSSTLAKELKAGALHGAVYPRGGKFVSALQRFLRREGYVR
jgi:hypothetical protein